jgi:hypothetical protein
MYQFDKSLERDTFLGKMQVFYPVFFLNISSEEFFYLKSNEQWVLGIFQDFWKLLINRTNAMKLHPASHDPSPDIRAHSFPSLVFAESLDQADHSRTPPHSLEHTRTACDPNLPSTSSSSPIVDPHNFPPTLLHSGHLSLPLTSPLSPLRQFPLRPSPLYLSLFLILLHLSDSIDRMWLLEIPASDLQKIRLALLKEGFWVSFLLILLPLLPLPFHLISTVPIPPPLERSNRLKEFANAYFLTKSAWVWEPH